MCLPKTVRGSCSALRRKKRFNAEGAKVGLRERAEEGMDSLLGRTEWSSKSTGETAFASVFLDPRDLRSGSGNGPPRKARPTNPRPKRTVAVWDTQEWGLAVDVDGFGFDFSVLFVESGGGYVGIVAEDYDPLLGNHGRKPQALGFQRL
jgi:hypothetical protein